MCSGSCMGKTSQDSSITFRLVRRSLSSHGRIPSLLQGLAHSRWSINVCGVNLLTLTSSSFFLGFRN